MTKRTFDIIAKYIAQKNDITIVWGEKGPCADPTTKTLWLTEPKEGEEESAMALLMHEAAHLGSTNIPKEGVYDNPEEFDIVNACEDIRIDNRNMQLLPNIDMFYRELYKQNKKYVQDKLKENPKLFDSVPLPARVMMNGILDLEGMYKYRVLDEEAEKFDYDNNIRRDMDLLVRCIERQDWAGARTVVKLLGAKFGFSPDKAPVQEAEGVSQEGGCKGGKKGASLMPDMGDKFKKGEDVVPGTLPGKGTCKGEAKQLSEIAITDQTMQALKDLLSESSIIKSDDPRQIDTDNLTAFMTEDIDELFYDEETKKVVKSKIFFLLDGSGSMGDRLLCGSYRNSVVAGCTKSVIKALEEVKLEGAEVDWEVFGFDSSLHELDKNDWENEYLRLCGGTNLLKAFEEAQDKMLQDQEIGGKKLIVIFTDGEVYHSDITAIKEHIMKYNEDVRCLLIGVGSREEGALKDILNGNNIVAKDLSDVILAEAIMSML